MGVRSYEDLVVWQLADQVRERVVEITARPAFASDLWLRRQLRSAADSACSAVAEGFGRFGAREFAYFLRVAIGSLEEIKNRRSVIVSIGGCSATEALELHRLASRACGAATNPDPVSERPRRHALPPLKQARAAHRAPRTAHRAPRTANREPRTVNRAPRTANREPRTANRTANREP
jgi:four helix bundle protein